MPSFPRSHRRPRRRSRHARPLTHEPLEPRHLLAAGIMISEFLARNDGGLRDAEGKSPDWIEVFNGAGAAQDLAGYRLTDDPNNQSQWVFPSVELGPGQYQVVFASGRSPAKSIDADGNLHANFSLKRGGEYLALIAPDGTVLSEYGPNGTNYPEQLPNVSYGVAQSLTLVDSGSQAWYQVPKDDQLGLDWTQGDFDAPANGFSAGTASLGMETNPNSRASYIGQFETALPDLTHAVYARMEFPLNDRTAVTDLRLNLKYDNGFVAYLNGVKVAEDNAPPQLNWFSTAPERSRSDSQSLEPVEFDLRDHLDALVDGTNVLAIHGLNNFGDDSDLLLVPELRATFSDMRAAIGAEARVGLMPRPTPGQPNGGNDQVFSGFVEDTTFSVDRGFYDSPQQVEITTATAGAEIRYTTDGSPPTADHGVLYQGPIPITTTMTLRAAAFKPGHIPSNVDTQTYIFLDDVLHQPARPPGWPTDSASWGGFTPDYEMDPDVVGPYGDTIKDDMMTLPSFSIVADPDDLFGPRGIMTRPTGQGTDWERPVSVELIQPDGGKGFQLNAVIRVAGSNWARTNIAKRGFRLLMKDQYGPNDLPTGGPTRLEFPLFPDTDVEQFDSIVLKGRADHSYLYTDAIRAQYVREHWSRDTMRDMGHVTTHGTYAHLYLNGLYWGLYAPFERPDGHFQAAYQGGEPDQWYANNGSSGWKGELGRDPLWNVMLGARDYETISQYLDMDNFIDYMMVNFYTGNVDWPEHNWWAARKNEPGAKYRFFQNDTEMSFYAPNATNMDNLGGDPGRLYRTLIQDPQFRLHFADRVQKHMFHGGALTPDAAAARWMSRASEIDRAIVAESARWGDNRRATPYTRDVEWVAERDRLLSRFFPTRTDFMIEQFRRRGLYPPTEAPSLSPHGGVVPAAVAIRITAPEGTVYYTTDGTDPRPPDGGVSATATEYTDPINLSTDTTIRARALHDGEWSAIDEGQFLVASELPLRITELSYDPYPANRIPGLEERVQDSDRFEFVELMNAGDRPIDLAGVRLVEEDVHATTQGIRFVFAPQSLDPGERLVVVRDREAFQSRYGLSARIAQGRDGEPGAPGEYGGKLANRGEQITLIDSTGKIIQRFSYGTGGAWPARAQGKGSSLEVLDPRGDHDHADNWRASPQFGGSPGAAGDGAESKIEINEVLAHTSLPQGDMVELHNPTGQPIDVGGWYLSDTSDNYFKFQFTDTTTLPPLGYQVVKAAELGFDLDGARGGELWLVESDGAGRPVRFADHVQFGPSLRGTSLGPAPGRDAPWVALAEPTFGQRNAGPRMGDVVISELQYAPSDPDGEGRLKADDFEFIELFNRTGQAVDVRGWQLAGDVSFTFSDSLVIGPGEAVVVVGFDPTASTRATVFRFTLGMAPSARLVGPYKKSLDDAEGLVQLIRPDVPPADQPDFTPLLVEDQVHYRSVPPWPSARAGDALDRVEPIGNGDSPISWVATTPSPGAVDFVLRHPGDANEDGHFDPLDIEQLLNGAKYLTGEAASWHQGDWSGDGVFDQHDIVLALQAGRFVPGL